MRRGHEPSRQRGSALIVVLIVVVGVIGMLGFLFPMSQRNILSQREARLGVDTQLLLQTAIADAFEEIRTESDSGTPNDGVGAVGCELVINEAGGFNISDALKNRLGIPLALGSGSVDDLSTLGRPLQVTVDLDGNGDELGAGESLRTLGRYITIVQKPTQDVRTLLIVVATPNFETPERMLGAEVRFAIPQGGSRSAISFTGGMGTPGSGNFKIGTGAGDENSISIQDPTGTVPAWNISDSTLRNDVVVTNFVSAMTLLQGLGGFNGGLPANGLDKDTISDYPDAGLELNQAQIDAIGQDVMQWVSDLKASGSNWWAGNWNWGRDFTINKTMGGTYDPLDPAATTLWRMGGPFQNNNRLKLNGIAVSGTGVLLIDRDCRPELTNGTFLYWNGDVIWVCGGNDDFRIEDASMKVDGNLIIIVPDSESNTEAELLLRRDNSATPRLQVNGSLVMISTKNNKVQFHMEGGGGGDYGGVAKINGLQVMLGANLIIDTKGGSDDGKKALWEVNGGLVVAAPNDGNNNLQKFRFDKDVVATFTYDQGLYDSALEGLAERFPSLIEWENKGWLERSGSTALRDILTVLLTEQTNTSNYSH